MELQSRKRMRPSVDDVGRDRLSEMPDEVIVHILSCMPILDAVRTVLLRRFGNLWTLVHTLKLDMLGFVDHLPTNNVQRKGYAEERFHNFVRNVLILHKRLSINKFHVRVKLHYPVKGSKAANEMKTWLRFALGREAKEINLCCKPDDYIFRNSSVLPHLTSQSLVTLELASCYIESRIKVNLPSLKKLLLDRCFMSNEDLQRFISGCPFLQELVIKNPEVMDKLSFGNPNIDKLSLVIMEEWMDVSLDCPNLKTLYLEMKCWPDDIIDVSSVRNVFVKTIPSIPDIYMNYFEGMWFYEKFGGAEVIHLSPDTSLGFLDTIRESYSYVKHKWKHVLLELKELCPRYLKGIYHLMKRLIYLEKLTIYTGQDFKARSDLHPSKVSSSHVPKTIVLYGYAKSWKSQLQLVEFLLKHAAGLNELFIISIKGGVDAAEELEFVKSVSRFPRASPRAKVHFE